MHLIAGMGETERDVLEVIARLRAAGGHSHMFAFFPERGSLMDHLPAVDRGAWRRVQLARYLMDYRGATLDRFAFDAEGRVTGLGIEDAERDALVASGIPFRTSGCPGKERKDVSACDRPYGDSPPSDIASFPFAPATRDIARIRRQLA
jgi:biotin synthase